MVHRYLEPYDCSAPKHLFYLVHRRWLDSGMVFSRLCFARLRTLIGSRICVFRTSSWTAHRKRKFCLFQTAFGFVRKCLGIINYKMLKTLWELVILDVVRAWACFTLFHLFIDWSGTWWLLAWCWCCCFGVCLVVCFVLSIPGLSFWPSCLTMTTLGQLHDCYSCNDERSIVQKKRLWICPFHVGSADWKVNGPEHLS